MHKKQYEKMTDEELIVSLRDGDTNVTDYLLEKYKPLVRQKAKSMYILGGSGEDLIQEGMIGLFKALRDYDCGRDASFKTFADLCILRQMYTAVESAGRMKHSPLNSYVPLNSASEEAGAEKMEAMIATTERSPEELLIDRENLKQLQMAIEKALSPLEKQVLDLHLTGMGYVDIAHVLGRDEKSTDNALQRVRSKIKKITEQRSYMK